MSHRDTAIYQLVLEAGRLADANLHREAAATSAVAADLAEEQGDARLARALRTDVRRHIVIEWARRRWPTENISADDVTAEWAHATEEQRRFRIHRSTLNVGDQPGHTEVLVSRRGRVTITGWRGPP